MSGIRLNRLDIAAAQLQLQVYARMPEAVDDNIGEVLFLRDDLSRVNVIRRKEKSLTPVFLFLSFRKNHMATIPNAYTA